MKVYRVYADTSVFGGCFDSEFEDASNAFFDLVKNGVFRIIISPILLFELENAPVHIQKLLANLPNEFLEHIEESTDVIFLRDEYIRAGILGKASLSDAEHVASASVFDADFIVSWNFKHIVHFDKINSFQAVNLLNGFKPIRIYSPNEVI